MIYKGPPGAKELYKAMRKYFRRRFPDYKFGSPQGKALPSSEVKEKPWRPETEKDLRFPPHKG